jgi:hypothetical protein
MTGACHHTQILLVEMGSPKLHAWDILETQSSGSLPLKQLGSNSVGCLFILVLISFDVQKLFNFRKSHLSILISTAIGVLLRKSLPHLYFQVFSAVLSKTWVLYFELIFI